MPQPTMAPPPQPHLHTSIPLPTTPQTPPIERLSGNKNYTTWKRSMKAVLNRDPNIWRVVSGQHINSVQAAANHAVILQPSLQPALQPASPPPGPQTVIEDQVYNERNEIAYDTIVLNIDPALQHLIVQHHNNGKAAWEALERLFELGGRLALRRQLFQNVRQTVAEPVAHYISRKLHVVHQLRELGAGELTDDTIADVVLMDVSPEFQPVQELFRSRPWYKFEDVRQELVKFEERQQSMRAQENRAVGGTMLKPGVGGAGMESRGHKRIADDPVLIAPAAKDEVLSHNGELHIEEGFSTPAKKPRLGASRANRSGKKSLGPSPSPQQGGLSMNHTSTPNTPQNNSTCTPSPANRPFRCLFSFAGCTQSFASKNEWKRHINHIHLQLWFWRCDFASCANRKAFFNRKDLFGQHLKRMHEQELVAEGCPEIQERCKKERRKPPDSSTCGFCDKNFEGSGSWETLVDHVGDHYAQGTRAEDWKQDAGFEEWAVKEGVVKKGPDGRYTQDERGFPDV